MQSPFTAAINQICDEKNLSQEVVMETVKAALGSAYKKDYGAKDQEVRVEIDEETGQIKVYVQKEVVAEVIDDKTQISVVAADRLKKNSKVGDTVEILDIPADFGRIAAQTAKQVIIQRIREAERDNIFEEYKDKESSIVNSVVQRVEGDTVMVDLGKATGVLFRGEQVPTEHYYVGQRLKVFVIRVESSAKGPQVVVSRSHPEFVRKLFEMEVPELLSGQIEIRSIAREAGQRTKIAVVTSAEGIDPVGALVGQRGSRVQSVTAEMGEEKIDVILWNEDLKTFITNALSPAKVSEIELNEKDKRAIVKVPDDQLSLAIGKKGQNVRLAAKLTGWNVDISGTDEVGVEKVEAAVSEGKPSFQLEEDILKSIESQQEAKEIAKEVVPEVEKNQAEIVPEVKQNENPDIAQTAEVVSDPLEEELIENIEGEKPAVKKEKNDSLVDTLLVETKETEVLAKKTEKNAQKTSSGEVSEADDKMIEDILEEEKKVK